ncbi:lantibiotic dehydratase [Bradyrhizobium sp. 143]|uniref:lantibiotic dehydratase n=2 Tax=unclassified Bradyrhizobium TaxID=2631580 RepID=UPI00320858E0
MSRLMLRSPSLPIQTLTSRAWRTAGDFTSDAAFSLALLTSSPSLHARLEEVLERGEFDARLLAKLRRVLTRMSARPTPFGLLAGVAFPKWGSQTDLLLTDSGRCRTRVDMDWIVDHVKTLEADVDIQRSIRWISHSAIWQHGGRAILSRGADNEPAASIACTAPVRLIFEQTASPELYGQIRDRVLANVNSATPEKFHKLFLELHRLGFLFSELMPPMIGTRDPLLWVIDRLPANAAGQRERTVLEKLRGAVSRCDIGAVPDRIKSFRAASALAREIRAHERPFPFQVDLRLGTKGEALNQTVGREAARAAQLLIEISGSSASSASAQRYHNAFLSKYGEGREVPFLEVAHPEWGLGLTPLRFGNAGASGNTQYYRREYVLHGLVQKALREGRITADLDEEEISVLRAGAAPVETWPISVDLNVFLLAESSSSIDAGNFTLCLAPNVGALKAGLHFARFGDLCEDAVLAVLNESAACERERASFREVVQLNFLPTKARLANVVLRPSLSKREANFGVSANVEPTNTIRLENLLVGSEGGRLYVRNSGSNKRLAFVSDCMLNPTLAPREIQVLLAITSDPVAYPTSFPWGALSGAVFLPRVTWKKTILQCAQWNLRAQPKSSTEVFKCWFREWRDRWLCPQHIYLCSGDHRLLLDLEDESQVEELRKTLTKEGAAILQEAVPYANDAWLQSQKGSHVTELVIPLRLRNIEALEAQQLPIESKSGLSANLRFQRFKPPGSDWVFLKLYGPPAGEDAIISGGLRDLWKRLPSDVKWHFVRYADPRPHLRLRFQSEAEGFASHMISELSRWATELLAKERCESFSFDVYEREIERYGGLPVISAAESIFAIDSGLAATLIAGGQLSNAMILKVFIIDKLLEKLGFASDGRISWLKEFVDLTQGDGVVYRKHKKEIVEALLSSPEGALKSASDWLDAHTHSFAHLSECINSANCSGTLTQPRAAISRSIIHMHCNRLWGLDGEKELEALRLLRRARQQILHL